MGIKHIILGLLGINLVIAVHEFGHWSLSKAFGVDTPRFAIGFGPVIFEKKVAQTLFTLSVLPIGGYVEIAGMRAPELYRPEHSFINKPFWQKTIIMLGGILFNLLFAFLVLAIMRFRRPTLEPATNETSTKKESGIIGPLGIITLASKSASYGLKFYFFFLAILSINLAFFNLFPLPILDGGQLLIQTIEALQGHQIQSSNYELLMSITMVFIFALLIYSTTRDIKRTV